eukprot:9376176-Pyramimonas_sp.AAC.1
MSKRAVVPRECAMYGIARHSMTSHRERDSLRQPGQKETIHYTGREIQMDGLESGKHIMRPALQREHDFEGPKPRKSDQSCSGST